VTGGFARLAAAVAASLVAALLAAACDYVVVPPDEGGPVGAGSAGWSAVPTAIGPSDDGGTRIDLAIRNDTGDWSAMAADGLATLRAGDGSTTDCATVDVGSGGHRLAPGFQMRGFMGGTKAEPELVQIGVECDVAEVPSGSTLGLDYSYVVGEFNYYDPDATRAEGTLAIPLDTIASDLVFPVGQPVEGLVQPADVEITAINDVVLNLRGMTQTDEGMEFAWEASNPGEYPSFVHIGKPPVIGNDGIIYGAYESPDLATVPMTPAGEKVEWTTTTAVPDGVEGLVMLLSVESKKQRLFVNYALDLAGAAS
jgi:hypothetical protein